MKGDTALNAELETEDFPQAKVRPRGRFSIVWLVPLLAIAIGGWLAWKAMVEQGPQITIVFQSAVGLDAGKTQIKFKDVSVGLVESLEFDEKLSHVIVTARLKPDMRPWLTKNAHFWVVKAKIGLGEISGLQTLLSGAYIAFEPGDEHAKSERSFTALNVPPPVSARSLGTRFQLHSRSLASLKSGSPIYYRQIKVGEVSGYQLAEDGNSILLDVFIFAPYDKMVFENSRFWNAGGVDVSLNASGLNIHTESLLALMAGGIAFAVPDHRESGKIAAAGSRFDLYADANEARTKSYQDTSHYILYFDESVRGLSKGAAVTLKGMQIGEVLDISMLYDVEKVNFRIKVNIEIQHDRVKVANDEEDRPGTDVAHILVRNGLRAQLKTGSLLTGQLFIPLDFFPELPEAKIYKEGNEEVIPTVPSALNSLEQDVADILDTVKQLPLQEIADNLNSTLQGTSRIANSPEWMHTINNANKVLLQAQKTLQNTEGLLQEDSPAYHELMRTMKEFSAAARSIREMADYLERHPDALLRGKSQ